ncbi:MAG TPA: hypothetical protein VHS99_19565 [Chloroflexota bacterium]|nr:hypothetical protein [Chloroflexota bacterium]
MERGRLLALGAVGVVVLTIVAAGVWSLLPRQGVMLPDTERRQLLQRAGLPANFPVHPYARRSAQPSQGGITYVLNEPVPDVVVWHEQSLPESGYQVFNADVEGQDEFLPHWLYFRGNNGTSGAILIRASGARFVRGGTEVKILSRGDARLATPTLPPGFAHP